MKTIEVTDEMYDALMALSKELNTQDHRMTQQPYFFQVREEIQEISDEDHCDGRIWLDEDYNQTEDTEEEIKKELEEREIEIPNNFHEMYEENSLELEEFMQEHGYTVGYYRNDHKFHNSFLTAKACDEFIAGNSYHYKNPVSYLDSCWRNPEMELVFKFLCELSGGKIHK